MNKEDKFETDLYNFAKELKAFSAKLEEINKRLYKLEKDVKYHFEHHPVPSDIETWFPRAL